MIDLVLAILYKDLGGPYAHYMNHPPFSHKIIRLILRPVVRLLIRHGHSYSEAIEALRAEYIDVAKTDLASQGHEVNASRISAATGIGRREVSSALKSPIEIFNHARIASRVLGAWEQDQKLRDKTGAPKALVANGRSSEFFLLVESISKDINPYTVLFELERTGAIRWINKEKIEIKKQEFIPKGEPEAGFEILSTDLDDMIVAVDENIYGIHSVPNLHLKTEYTNVKYSAVEEIREWIIKEGSKFHTSMREFVSKFDIDISPDTDQKTGIKTDRAGIRVALGTFSRIVMRDGKEKDE